MFVGLFFSFYKGSLRFDNWGFVICGVGGCCYVDGVTVVLTLMVDVLDLTSIFVVMVVVIVLEPSLVVSKSLRLSVITVVDGGPGGML